MQFSLQSASERLSGNRPSQGQGTVRALAHLVRYLPNMPTPLLNAIESGFDTRGQRGKGEKPNLEIPKTWSPALASMPGRTRGWNKSCVLSLQQCSTGRLQEDKASIFIDLLHTSPRSGRFVRDIQAKPYICNAGYKRIATKGEPPHQKGSPITPCALLWGRMEDLGEGRRCDYWN